MGSEHEYDRYRMYTLDFVTLHILMFSPLLCLAVLAVMKIPISSTDSSAKHIGCRIMCSER